MDPRRSQVCKGLLRCLQFFQRGFRADRAFRCIFLCNGRFPRPVCPVRQLPLFPGHCLQESQRLSRLQARPSGIHRLPLPVWEVRFTGSKALQIGLLHALQPFLLFLLVFLRRPHDASLALFLGCRSGLCLLPCVRLRRLRVVPVVEFRKILCVRRVLQLLLRHTRKQRRRLLHARLILRLHRRQQLCLHVLHAGKAGLLVREQHREHALLRALVQHKAVVAHVRCLYPRPQGIDLPPVQEGEAALLRRRLRDRPRLRDSLGLFRRSFSVCLADERFQPLVRFRSCLRFSCFRACLLFVPVQQLFKFLPLVFQLLLPLQSEALFVFLHALAQAHPRILALFRRVHDLPQHLRGDVFLREFRGVCVRQLQHMHVHAPVARLVREVDSAAERLLAEVFPVAEVLPDSLRHKDSSSPQSLADLSVVVVRR